MRVTDARLAIPKYRINQIIQARTYSVEVTNSVSQKSANFQTPLSSNFLPIGIYSFDGGTTWYDFGNYSLPSGLTAAPAVGITAGSNAPGLLVLNVDQTALVGGGGTFTLMAEFAAMAFDGHGTVNPEQIVIDGDALYTSRQNYPKVYSSGFFEVVASSAHQETISHTLGYEQHVLAYMDDNDGEGYKLMINEF